MDTRGRAPVVYGEKGSDEMHIFIDADKMHAFIAVATAVMLCYIAGLFLNGRQKIAHGRRSSLTAPVRYATREQRQFVYFRDGGRCRHCGCQVMRTRQQVPRQANFDHIIPWARGGFTTLENLQLLCRKCNLRKGARFTG